MMRILLVNQFFWPDAGATAQLLTDVACDLAERGHDVTALCAPATYARQDAEVRPPVRIMRAGSRGFSRNRFRRIVSYAQFLAAALWYAARTRAPDVVLTLTTPPLIASVGGMLAARGARHYIWEMDLYPEVATDVGLLPSGGLAARLIGWAADRSRRRASRIIALGDCMRARLLARGIPSSRVVVSENWADGRRIRPAPFPQGVLTVLYSGNLGLAHDVDTVRAVLSAVRDWKHVRFVFGGGGVGLEALRVYASTECLRNVDFLPYERQCDFSQRLGSAHIGLVTQHFNCSGSVVPSKIYPLMAAGRPILYIGPRTATPSRTIRQFSCGWTFEPGAVDGITGLLLRLSKDRQPVFEAGRLARAAFDAHYDVTIGVANIRNILGV